jgi:hypothetical protein
MFFWGAPSLLPLLIILAGLVLFLCAKVLLAALLFAVAVLAVAARPPSGEKRGFCSAFRPCFALRLGRLPSLSTG